MVFGCNRRSNFDSMQMLTFCTLSLKMPIHALKVGVFVGFYSQNGEQYERDPQKAHFWAETRRMTYIVKIGPLVRARREPKNKAKS